MIGKWIDCDLKAPFHSRRIYFLAFLAMLAIVAMRFWAFIPPLMIGDDLSSYWFYQDVTLHSVLTDAVLEKYRPVPAFLFWMELHVFGFGANTGAHWAVGVLIHAVNATLAFAIFRHLSGGRLMLSGVLAVLAAISHFALYQITQTTGLVEGPSLTFFLIVLLTLLTPSNLHSRAHLAVLLGAAFLLMHTHERYIGVMPWAGMVIMLSPRFREIELKRRLYVAAGLIAIPIYYVGYKSLALDTSFLVGTGGKHIAIDFASILQFTKEAMLSLLGINYGPPYLVGINLVTAHKIIYQIPALAVALSTLCILALAIVAKGKGKEDVPQGGSDGGRAWGGKIIPVELVVLAMLVLGPALLTIRFEQRWLLTPYILLLALIAWSAARVDRDSQRVHAMPVLLGVFVSCTFFLQIAISGYLKNTFFVSAQGPAEVIRKDLGSFIDPASRRIGVFGNKRVCVWMLERGKFVELYFPDPKPEIVCGENIALFEFEGDAAISKVVGFNRAETRLIDRTEWIKAQKDLAADLKRMRYDFIRDFDKGEVIHAKLNKVPLRGGPFVNKPRRPDAALVVRDDFGIRFKGIDVKPNDTLRFWLSAAPPVRGQIRATVRIRDERSGKEQVLFLNDFATPGNDDGEPQGLRVSIPLDAYKGRNVSVTFTSATVGGEASNKHWASFEHPRIVPLAIH